MTFTILNFSAQELTDKFLRTGLVLIAETTKLAKFLENEYSLPLDT